MLSKLTIERTIRTLESMKDDFAEFHKDLSFAEMIDAIIDKLHKGKFKEAVKDIEKLHDDLVDRHLDLADDCCKYTYVEVYIWKLEKLLMALWGEINGKFQR